MSITDFETIITNNLNILEYTLMVLDIQGAELKVFQGMDDSVFATIQIIVVEISVCQLYKDQGVFDDLIIFLKSKVIFYYLFSVFLYQLCFTAQIKMAVTLQAACCL